MVKHVVERILNIAKTKKIDLNKARVLIMGLTFKENCPDLRNSLSFRLVDKLSKISKETHTYDPHVNKINLKSKYRKKHIQKLNEKNYYNVIILTVAHDEFKKLGYKKIKSFASNKSIIYDLKYILTPSSVDGRL